MKEVFEFIENYIKKKDLELLKNNEIISDIEVSESYWIEFNYKNFSCCASTSFQFMTFKETKIYIHLLEDVSINSGAGNLSDKEYYETIDEIEKYLENKILEIRIQHKTI